MFKFNFSGEKKDSYEKVCDEEETNQWYKSKEVKVPSDTKDLRNKISRSQITKLDYDCDITFNCLLPREVLNMLKEKTSNENFLDVLAADKQHSDLVPGKYEGGLKTWECTKDLAVYFKKHIIGNANKLNGKSVLDLGCGTGILGIMCLLEGAFVTFQDYVSMFPLVVGFKGSNICFNIMFAERNDKSSEIFVTDNKNQEVLEAMTIPNIFLNCEDSVINNIKLFSGDWSSFLQLMMTECGEDQRYDYILTSETIYNPENYKKIIEIIKNLIKPDGTVFVAAKTHYFGVGGNLNEFRNLLEQKGLHCSTCWKTTEGVSREILEIKLK